MLTSSEFSLLQSDVILSLQIRGKHCHYRRIRFLACRGWILAEPSTAYNFGRAGTVKMYQYDGVHERFCYAKVQISCARGGRAKNGYLFNICTTYVVASLSYHEAKFFPSQF